MPRRRNRARRVRARGCGRIARAVGDPEPAPGQPTRPRPAAHRPCRHHDRLPPAACRRTQDLRRPSSVRRGVASRREREHDDRVQRRRDSRGAPVSKGMYGLHMIPREGAWTVILSKSATSWGSFTYDPAEDALRFEVTPRTIANQQALTYDFDNPTADAVVVAMRWEQRAVPFSIRVDTPAIGARSLRNQLRGR